MPALKLRQFGIASSRHVLLLPGTKPLFREFEGIGCLEISHDRQSGNIRSVVSVMEFHQIVALDLRYRVWSAGFQMTIRMLSVDLEIENGVSDEIRILQLRGQS